MHGIVQMVIEKFSRSYLQYRFDKISNFSTYDQFKEEKAIDKIIKLGEELQRIKDFKKNTDKELLAMEDKWHEVHSEIDLELSRELSNKIYAKKQGIRALHERKRREVVAYMQKLELEERRND